MVVGILSVANATGQLIFLPTLAAMGAAIPLIVLLVLRECVTNREGCRAFIGGTPLRWLSS